MKAVKANMRMNIYFEEVGNAGLVHVNVGVRGIFGLGGMSVGPM